jgi:3-oxoacyl-[acyl-carrier protein] reductase
MEIRGKTILITGGAGALGQGMVQSLLDKGAQVVVFDVNQQALEQLCQSRPSVSGHLCDVTCEASVQQAVEAVMVRHGAIHVLINNVGWIHSMPLINIMSREDKKHTRAVWDKSLNLNLTSVFNVTVRVVEQMIARRTKGVLIQMSSISAQGNAGQSAYSACKAAVNALTVTWAKELGPMGIRSVAIAPGFFETESTHEALSDGVIKGLKRQVPLRRFGRAEEMAKSVISVIENDYLNGTVLEVDGGLSL